MWVWKSPLAKWHSRFLCGWRNFINLLEPDGHPFINGTFEKLDDEPNLYMGPMVGNPPFPSIHLKLEFFMNQLAEVFVFFLWDSEKRFLKKKRFVKPTTTTGNVRRKIFPMPSATMQSLIGGWLGSDEKRRRSCCFLRFRWIRILGCPAGT